MGLEVKFNRRYLNGLLKSDEVHEVVNDQAEAIADLATQMSGYKYKASQSKNKKRASAAALPDEYGAVVSENKHNHLTRIMNSI